MQTIYSDTSEVVKRPESRFDHPSVASVVRVFDGRVVTDNEGAGSAPGCAVRQDDAPGDDPSPCLLRNKCDKGEGSKGRLSGKEMRSKDLCCRTIEDAVRRYGWGSSVVLCLTDGGIVGDERGASRRFKNLWDGYFKRRGYRGYVRVIERGEKTGRVHIHALVIAPEGVSVGYRDQYDRLHRSKWFRGEQAGFNSVTRGYGFGIEQYEVIRKSGLSVGRYFGKYASKGIGDRYSKGVRVWSCSAGLSIGSVTKTGSATAGGWAWRLKLNRFCEERGVHSEEQAAARWGHSWKYDLSVAIKRTIIPGVVNFASPAHARVLKADLPSEYVKGKLRYGVWMDGVFCDLVFPCRAKTMPYVYACLMESHAEFLREQDESARLQVEQLPLDYCAPVTAPE